MKIPLLGLRPPVWLVAAAFTLACLAGPAPARAQDAAAAGPPPSGPAGRPRLGLALGGGAARGIAHVGFLRWLEEHRIPVDVVAGTSMGGLVGGAYASGMDADELQRLLEAVDWDLVFVADSPFKYKSFRRKEDARAYPAQLEFGLKKGFKLPSGLNAGQQIELLLDRIALPYYGIGSFDELPTPFRAVATDLRASEVVVLGSGSLSQAMRATMAIPAYFTPVQDGNRLLVDGGTLNNVPADVTRTMGADVVIAVNVGSSTDQPPPPASLFGVLGQTMDTMMQSGVRRALKDADLVVTPDLKGLTGMDWRKTGEMVARGYKAAGAASAELLKYAVDGPTYDQWKRARQARCRQVPPSITAVRVEGVPDVEERDIHARLASQMLGRPLDRERLEQALLRLTGSDRYEVIGYQLADNEGGGAALVVRITPKAYGPPFLLPAIDLQNIDSSSFALNLRGRFAFYDTLVSQSEIRADVALGSTQAASVEFYRRLGKSGLFVAPRGYFMRRPINVFSPEGDFIAEYREKRSGAGVDVGFTTALRNEVRVGYDAADVRVRRRIGEVSLPEAEGGDRFFSLRWAFDGQTSPQVPTRGIRSQAEVRYYVATPDLVYQDGSRSDAKDFAQGEVTANWFKTVRGRHRAFVFGGAGTSFGDQPGYHRFRLGGLWDFAAFNNDEVTGSNYVYGSVGLMWHVFRLSDVLGGNGYLAGWLNDGTAFDEWNDAKNYASLTGGFVLETILGPVFVGGSVSLNRGDARFYVLLGPFLR